jgi:DNA-binding transcriptional MerR regulator
MKRAGGRRFYRPQDVAVLADIHRLLHQAGYTIKGVQQLHRVGGLKALSCAEAATEPPTASANESVYSQIVAPSPALSCRAGRPTQPEARQKLEQALSGLLAAKARLDALLADSHAMIQASE